MKRIIAVFILGNIFLSSFFAQEANHGIWNEAVTIHSDLNRSGNHNYHKGLVFSEFSNETEDSEEKGSIQLQLGSYHNLISENKYIINRLSSFGVNLLFLSNLEYANPIFLKNRSILI